jgi:KDO2-lipid IV(A) lauroyltransferase
MEDPFIMANARSRIADYAVFLMVRLLVCVIQCLSFAAARKVALGLAWLAYHLDRRHREVARENLRHALGGQKSEREIDELVRAVYRHFCTVIVEIVHLPRKLHTANWRRYMELVHGDRVIRCMLSGRPLLIVTGHFGNWEMAGYALGLLGFPTYAIARPLDNPYLNDFLSRFREKTGQKILAKHGDFDELQKVLASGGVVATLADQDAGQRGLFVDFFGRPASTHKAIALLALQHRVPMAVVGTPRVGEPWRYQIITEDVIFPEEYDNHPDPVRAITQRFTSALERLIRAAPEQYFWLHRRWKHQPAKSKRKQAA